MGDNIGNAGLLKGFNALRRLSEPEAERMGLLLTTSLRMRLTKLENRVRQSDLDRLFFNKAAAGDIKLELTGNLAESISKDAPNGGKDLYTFSARIVDPTAPAGVVYGHDWLNCPAKVTLLEQVADPLVLAPSLVTAEVFKNGRIQVTMKLSTAGVYAPGDSVTGQVQLNIALAGLDSILGHSLPAGGVTFTLNFT